MKGKKPLQEIAAELGISPAAISFVLNNKKGVSEATRAEAAALLEHYGYTIKKGTQDLKEGNLRQERSIRFLKYKNSAILVEENGNFVSSIIDSLEAGFQRYGEPGRAR